LHHLRGKVGGQEAGHAGFIAILPSQGLLVRASRGFPLAAGCPPWGCPQDLDEPISPKGPHELSPRVFLPFTRTAFPEPHIGLEVDLRSTTAVRDRRDKKLTGSESAFPMKDSPRDAQPKYHRLSQAIQSCKKLWSWMPGLHPWL
jgi:hypothetical protein